MKGLERRAWSVGGALPLAALALVLAGASGTAAFAQAAPVITNTTTPPPDTVGPRELHDFSLGGTRLPSPDATPADPTQSGPRPTQAPRPAPRAAGAPPRPAASTPSPSAAPTVADEPAPSTPTSRRPAPPPAISAPPAREVTVPLPPADPLARDATPAPATEPRRRPMPPMPGSSGAATSADDDQGPAYWPWLLALAVLAGAAIVYLFRDRIGVGSTSDPALASASFDLAPADETPAPEPWPRSSREQSAPAVLPAAVTGGITVARPSPFLLRDTGPVAAVPSNPAPAAVRPAGIVSTRLRPWLEISFVPARAVIDETRASVQFDIIVTNSGSAPARDVLIEACMINAGPEQDAELRRFFEQPAGQGERIDAIPPLGKIQLNSSVAMSLEQARAYEVGGRKLFVPLVAFNALYGWGGNKGQSSASYLVGRGHVDGEGDSEARMAPLRLDLGPRIFRDLDTRRHPLGMRV